MLRVARLSMNEPCLTPMGGKMNTIFANPTRRAMSGSIFSPAILDPPTEGVAAPVRASEMLILRD